MKPAPVIVGLGELLWDLLPSGRQLGGAPANFAYCSHLLGNRALVVSRVGDDALGNDARKRLRQAGISDEFVQTDSSQPTGTVNVEVDNAGQPRFEIASPAAWDYLEWNKSLDDLAQSCDAVCFGTLAQRSEQARCTTLKFLDATRRECLRIFDVNLRQSFYSPEILRESLSRANALKLNEHELPTMAESLGIVPHNFCKTILTKFKLRLVCLTRGENGSVLFEGDAIYEHPGFHVRVKDTVGAGDAFTAGFVHEYLRGESLEKINDTANRMGAWLASCAGAMPVPAHGLSQVLAQPELKI